MAVTISRLDRYPWTIAEAALRAKLPHGGPSTISAVDVAVLPIGAAPTAATTWTTSGWSGAAGSGVGSLTLAGPDADSTSALVVTANADLWVKATGAPYVEAIKWERVTVRDTSGTIPALPNTAVASVNGKSGTVTLTFSDVGADAAGAATAAQTAAQTFATNAVATQATADRAAYGPGGTAGNVSAPTAAGIAAGLALVFGA